MFCYVAAEFFMTFTNALSSIFYNILLMFSAFSYIFLLILPSFLTHFWLILAHFRVLGPLRASLGYQGGFRDHF